MNWGILRASGAALGLMGLALVATASCNGDRPVGGDDVASALDASVSPAVAPTKGSTAQALAAPTQPNYFAGPVDDSQSVVQRSPRVSIAQPFASRPFRDIPNAQAADEDKERPEHEPGRSPFTFAPPLGADPVLQSGLPTITMPVTIQNFLGQGTTLGGCVFPKPDAGEPAGCTTRGDPPDTVGAVGPNHYVQAINSGIAIWSKNGTLLQTPKFTSTLWTGFPTADGNKCGASPAAGGDWGDAVVMYDQLADRWIITQFDITNGVNNNTGPSYQCVAVSQSGDPTGAYWLYDFQYAAAINDYGKFSVWPDAYYASFNDFNTFFTGAQLCAYDRVKMLQGQPATQQCFSNSGFGFLPGNLDGQIHPPLGESAFFLNLRNSTSLGLYKFHTDWATPANSTFTGPTAVTVASYGTLCGGGNCVTQPAPGNALASLGDRPMFRLVYRNFGTHEALFAVHSVTAGAAGGVRWYEIRSPNATPSVFQQGTYAPADGAFRWMGSIAQDQAQDIALGFSISSGTTKPSIAWTGRLATDVAGTMGQAEAVILAGGGVETGTFSNGQAAARWGDYSSMTVDPTDDCTFWYTQEAYPSNGIFNYDTRVSSVKFPNCAANDFTIGVLPATLNLQQGKTVAYTVSTVATKGTPESIALNVQDLPTGVSGAFVPPSINAGASSTLTLTATAAAPLTGSPAPTFTVIGKAPSAVHAATAQVAVVACLPSPCASGQNCGTIPDGCGGTTTCGPACTAPQTCGGGGSPNVCGCTPITACGAGQNCGTIPDGCNGQLSCGPACVAPQTCGGGGTPNVCGCTPITSCPAGKNCGTMSDGCSGTVTCGGACVAPQTCAGGGVANVCGCSPLTVCPGGQDCNTASDGCGGTLPCGSCTAPKTCGGGGTPDHCGCTPQTTCPNGQKCGTAPNGCGGTINCGTCAAPQTCGGGGTQNQCGCTATTCAAQGAECDSINDACGGTLSCGTCSADKTCVANKCVVPSGPGPGSDAAPPPGADGSTADGSAGDGGSGGTGDNGGCGCRTVESRKTPGWALFAASGLGAAFVVRRRRSRKERRPSA